MSHLSQKFNYATTWDVFECLRLIGLNKMVLSCTDKVVNKDVISGVYQEYSPDRCNRQFDPGHNKVNDMELWETSIPHTQDSGRCFTYKYNTFF